MDAGKKWTEELAKEIELFGGPVDDEALEDTGH